MDSVAIAMMFIQCTYTGSPSQRNTHFDKRVILDEVRRAPGLFPVLRGLIDRIRRQDRRSGRYLLLGSASLELLRQYRGDVVQQGTQASGGQVAILPKRH